MPTLNILLIDESYVEFRLIGRMLKTAFKSEYVLRHATSLDKGKSILKTQHPDVILLDFNLGSNLYALGFIAELKAVSSKTPMILMSSEINATYLKDKVILDVYDIVDKFNLRQSISDGLLKAL